MRFCLRKDLSESKLSAIAALVRLRNQRYAYTLSPCWSISETFKSLADNY